MKKFILLILIILVLNVVYALEDFESLSDGTTNVKSLVDKYYTLKAPETAANAYSYNTLERASLDSDVRAQALYNDALGFKQIAELRREFRALPSAEEIKKEATAEKTKKKSLCAEITETYGKPFSCQKLAPGQKPDSNKCITGRSCRGEFCCGEGDLYCCAEGFGESAEVSDFKKDVPVIINNIIIEIEDGNLREPNLQFMFDNSWKWRTKIKKEFNNLEITKDSISEPSEWFKSIIINLRGAESSFEGGIKLMVGEINNKKPNVLEGGVVPRLILLGPDPDNKKLQIFEAYTSGEKQEIIYSAVVKKAHEKSQVIEMEKKREVQSSEKRKEDLSQVLIEVEDGNPSIMNIQFILSNDEWKWKISKDKNFLSVKTKEIDAPFFSFEFDFTPDAWFGDLMDKLEKENTLEGGLNMIVEEVNKKEPFLPQGGGFVKPAYPKIILMKGTQRKLFQVQKDKPINYNEVIFSTKYATTGSISQAK